MPVIDLGRVIGPPGETGPQGAQGARGPEGTPGPNTVTNSTLTPLTGVLVGNGSNVGIRDISGTPTSGSDALLTSGGAFAALLQKAAHTEIAPYESSSTASRAYGVGQRFCYGNNLYVATAEIASGGTITPGTNCVAISAAGLFNPTPLTSANDLDDLSGDGFYSWGASSKPDNIPKQNVGFVLQISASATRKWQLSMLTVSSAPEVWARIKETNWSAWVQL